MKKVKWKFKKGAEPQGNGDFWYDLTMGGYIKPIARAIREDHVGIPHRIRLHPVE